MTATEQDPPPLYHGTRRPFQRGGLLMPRAWHGGGATSAPLNPGAKPNDDAENWVYLSTSRIVAWVYAWHAAGRGRPRVLTVTPLGPVFHDPEHAPDMLAYRTEAATVVSVDLDPMVSEAEVREGWVTE